MMVLAMMSTGKPFAQAELGATTEVRVPMSLHFRRNWSTRPKSIFHWCAREFFVLEQSQALLYFIQSDRVGVWLLGCRFDRHD